jgi:hypothetical protein
MKSLGFGRWDRFGFEGILNLAHLADCFRRLALDVRRLNQASVGVREGDRRIARGFCKFCNPQRIGCPTLGSWRATCDVATSGLCWRERGSWFGLREPRVRLTGMLSGGLGDLRLVVVAWLRSSPSRELWRRFGPAGQDRRSGLASLNFASLLIGHPQAVVSFGVSNERADRILEPSQKWAPSEKIKSAIKDVTHRLSRSFVNQAIGARAIVGPFKTPGRSP